MALKGLIENNPFLIIAIATIAGFSSGAGAIDYLDARDDKLKQEIMNSLLTRNGTLEADKKELESNRQELEDFVKKVVNELAAQKAPVEISPVVEEPAELTRAREVLVQDITKADRGEIANILRDPVKDISVLFK